jgi:hypothetical protein
MKNPTHILTELTNEIDRLKRKSRNYKQACKYLTRAYDKVRNENHALAGQLAALKNTQQPTVG